MRKQRIHDKKSIRDYIILRCQQLGIIMPETEEELDEIVSAAIANLVENGTLEEFGEKDNPSYIFLKEEMT